MPAVRRREDFDEASGSPLERLVFRHRPVLVAACAIATAVLGWLAATRHTVNADLEALMPQGHPYVRNYLAHRDELRGLGSSLLVVVENARGDVYDPAYLEALRWLTDELFLTPGVARAWVRSLWMPAVRWSEVTEEGFSGGPVMPEDYDGSPAALEALRRNVLRAGLAGSLVARDGRSSAVIVPLLERDPVTGAGIDHGALGRRLEALRLALEGPRGDGPVRVHVVGFAKLAGDLVAGVRQVTTWFAIAAAVVAALLLAHTRCARSAALVVACAAVAVVWQLGIAAALGLAQDPFTSLVPFLVFTMGVSHGAQKTNGILLDVGRGTHPLVAARYTFRRLFLAGFTALVTDAVGFAVLGVLPVPAIRRLALTATIGVSALVVTSLLLLPVLLSYTGVSRAAAARALRAIAADAPPAAPWRLLERLATRRWATAVLALSAPLVAAGVLVARRVRVGDVEPGAPELRPSARYNRDVAFVASGYDVSSDQLAVIVTTPEEGCLDHHTLVEADRLGWALQQVPGVRATSSLADAVRQVTAGTYEGSPKWLTLSRNQLVLNHAAQQALARSPDLVNARCSVMPVVAYLSDHRAETLEQVVRVAEDFAAAHGDRERRFLLAAGSAGIEAATNAVVREARWTMTIVAYGAVLLLCLATLRSWRAALVTLLPLAATSVACTALMAALGIGVKLATLPVIALGVGIPDFSLYLLSVQLAHQRAGEPLEAAHRASLRFTGRVVAFVSLTLAAGVVTWCWSPIRLQADMGLLLTFMFLGNMGAALVLVPALSRFLLDDPHGARAWTLASR